MNKTFKVRKKTGMDTNTKNYVYDKEAIAKWKTKSTPIEGYLRHSWTKMMVATILLFTLFGGKKNLNKLLQNRI